MVDTGSDLAIGGYLSAGSYSAGSIDEVRVYGSELSASAVARLAA